MYRRAIWLSDTLGTRVCAQIARFSSFKQIRRLRPLDTLSLDSVHYPQLDTTLPRYSPSEEPDQTLSDRAAAGARNSDGL